MGVAALILLGASAVCVALVIVRAAVTGHLGYRFLVWNLILAWVPFLLAWLLAGMDRRRSAGWLLLGVGALWLLFFPNAPYIVTDFIHLGRWDTSVPLWFDAALIGAFALTGLLLGYASLAVVQDVVARRAGRTVGWTVALGALALCALGVYLGRVHRFNSWDALVDPTPLLRVVAIRLQDPLGNPAMVVLVGLLTVSLAVTYAVSRRVMQGSSRLRQDAEITR